MVDDFNSQFVAFLVSNGASSQVVQSLFDAGFTHGQIVDFVRNGDNLEDVVRLIEQGCEKHEVISITEKASIADYLVLLENGFSVAELNEYRNADSALIELLAGMVRNGHHYDGLQSLLRTFRRDIVAEGQTQNTTLRDFRKFLEKVIGSFGSTLDDFGDGIF